MIASLKGKILVLEDNALILDVGGVGYRVHVPATVLGEMEVGSETRLHIHMHVRETEMELFGASDAATLTFFKLLLTVSGVGPKVALATLSTLDAGRLSRAILTEDTAQITSVPGIGKKTAQRIILDLKSKVESEAYALELGGSAPASPIAAASIQRPSKPSSRSAIRAAKPGAPWPASIPVSRSKNESWLRFSLYRDRSTLQSRISV